LQSRCLDAALAGSNHQLDEERSILPKACAKQVRAFFHSEGPRSFAPNRRAGTSQADSFSSFYFGINANRVSDNAAISFERNGEKRTGNVP
jgi:hypothetical protein